MKNYAFKLMLLMALLVFLGCSSDNSSDPPCEISCENGGAVSASDCQCECPENYTGFNCSVEVVPNSITITKATVVAFPLINGMGDTWDSPLLYPDDLPDIYITFENSNLNVIYDSPIYYLNALPNGTNYEFEPNLQITNFNAPFLVNIWDYDEFNADDLMVYEAFVLYTLGEGFPTTISIVDGTPGEEIIVDLELTYNW